jgi:hypothetical protein
MTTKSTDSVTTATTTEITMSNAANNETETTSSMMDESKCGVAVIRVFECPDVAALVMEELRLTDMIRLAQCNKSLHGTMKVEMKIRMDRLVSTMMELEQIMGSFGDQSEMGERLFDDILRAASKLDQIKRLIHYEHDNLPGGWYTPTDKLFSYANIFLLPDCFFTFPVNNGPIFEYYMVSNGTDRVERDRQARLEQDRIRAGERHDVQETVLPGLWEQLDHWSQIIAKYNGKRNPPRYLDAETPFSKYSALHIVGSNLRKDKSLTLPFAFLSMCFLFAAKYNNEWTAHIIQGMCDVIDRLRFHRAHTHTSQMEKFRNQARSMAIRYPGTKDFFHFLLYHAARDDQEYIRDVQEQAEKPSSQPCRRQRRTRRSKRSRQWRGEHAYS